MQLYLCTYYRPDVHDEVLYFPCNADDADHAKEQLLDAEPQAANVSVKETR
jgi:hypothetical protein